MKRFLRHFLTTLSILLMLPFVNACGPDNDEPEIPEGPDGAKKVHRTVLIYMVADNGLGYSSFDKMDLDEMVEAAKAGGLNGGRLIIFHASSDKNTAPALKEIKNDGTITVLKEYDNKISSVAASTMEQAIADMKELAPADDYGIVLWSHGSGWLVSTNCPDPLYDESDMIRPLAFGQSAQGQSMNIAVLARVLKGKNFSFIYFDCCYMATIEVAYELRNVTNYIVGSVTELPNEGMVYNKNIPCFFTSGAPNLVQAARNTYEEYDARTDFNRSCTMSVIKTSALDALAKATRDIYEPVDCTMLPADYTPQPFMYESICYYFDFADYVHAIAIDNAALARWDKALADAVLYEAHTPYMWKGYNNDRNLIVLKTHCGLSTYIFKNAHQMASKGYESTAWYKDVAHLLAN